MASWTEERQNVPVGTVTDLDTQAPRTIRRDRDHLLIPELRLDAEGCKLLRGIINDELLNLAAVHDEIAEDEVERRAGRAACRECLGSGLIPVGRCNCGSPADISVGYMHERLCGYEQCPAGCPVTD
jgi:hypothetical protein